MFYIITVNISTHIIFLITYPDTTFMGPMYLFISFLLWSSFFYLMKTAIIRFSRDTKITIFTIIYIIMLLSIMSFYPQKDGLSVYSKVIEGKFPDRFSIYRGLKSFGIDYPSILGSRK